MISCSSKENDYQDRLYIEGEAQQKQTRRRNVLGINWKNERNTLHKDDKSYYLDTRGREESKEVGVSSHKRAKKAVEARWQIDVTTPELSSSSSSSSSSSTRYAGIDFDRRISRSNLHWPISTHRKEETRQEEEQKGRRGFGVGDEPACPSGTVAGAVTTGATAPQSSLESLRRHRPSFRDSWTSCGRAEATLTPTAVVTQIRPFSPNFTNSAWSNQVRRSIFHYNQVWYGSNEAPIFLPVLNSRFLGHSPLFLWVRFLGWGWTDILFFSDLFFYFFLISKTLPRSGVSMRSCWTIPRVT